MTLRAAGVASAAWVAIALAFFGVLLLVGESGDAQAFLAGYLVEKSLSLDNVFVFLLVFARVRAWPDEERHRLLSYGIVLALVLRGVFIVVGAAALSAFGWLSFVFAAFLIWTGWRLFRHRHDHDSEEALVGRIREKLPFSPKWAALAGIALVDILFAVDSVPAILAITNDTFIVFAANAFALLGLRPLFFLVADLVERLYYLKTALAALLIFIGAKLAAAEFVGKIGPEISLPVDRRDPRDGRPRLAVAGPAVVQGADRNRTGVNGFAGRCVATPPRRRGRLRVPGRVTAPSCLGVAVRHHDGTVEAVIAELARVRHGVVTRRRLLAAGVTLAEVRSRLRSGSLLLEYPGVYRVGHQAPSREATYLAAVEACGGGALLCGRAAAHLHALDARPGSSARGGDAERTAH